MHSSEQSKTLNVSVTYQDALANLSDNDIQAFTEHQLSVVATASPDSNLQAGDSVTVTYVVTNNGTAPAYDVTLSDSVDVNLFIANSVLTGSTGCSYANPKFGCSFASIAVGASETVSYTGTVQMDVKTGASFNISGDVSGDSQAGVVSNERESGGSGSVVAATQALAVNQLSVIASSETFTTTATTEPLAIGETITYELTVTIPEGISLQSNNHDFISFDLPAGLQYISNSALIRAVADSTMASVTLAGNIATTDTALEPTIDDAASISGQHLTFDLGDIDNNDDDVNEEQLIITITALVLNTDANTSGHSLVTTGGVNFLNQAAAPQTDSENHSSNVVVPDLALTHTATPASVQGGDTVTYTLTVTNTNGANTSNGYDWSIDGYVPAVLTTPTISTAVLSRGNVDIIGCTSFAGNNLSIDGSCLAGGQQGGEHYLAPGETITVVYQASVDPSIGFEQTVANTMNVSITSLPSNNGSAAPGAAGSDTGERIGDNSNNTSAQAVNDLVKMATANIVSNAPSLTLNSSVAQAPILSEVTLHSSFAVPIGTSTNFAFNLDLPSGLTYVNEAIIITLPGNDFTASLSPNTTPGAGTDAIVLNFGTITNNAASSQTVTVAIKVVVDNILTNQDSRVLASTATLTYSGSVSAPTDTATITVVEPNLTINQLITAGNVGSDAGDTVSYQVTVENTDTNATAYRVNLSDVLPAELLGAPDGAGAGPVISNIHLTNPADVILLSGTATALNTAHTSISTTDNANDTLSFTAFDLPPATRLTYRYDVVIANSSAVGASVINTSRADYSSLITGTGRRGSLGTDDDNDAVLDNYFDSSTSTLVLASNIAVQHGLTAGQADANFSIGETVSMDIRVDISEGKTNNVILTQVLDTGLNFVTASVVAAGHISYTGSGIASESPAGTISVDMGDVSNSADLDNANNFFIWRIISQVSDVDTNVAATVLNANASATSAVGNAGPDTLAITVVEPNLVATITPSSATTSLGDEVTFTVVITHDNSGADAFDTSLKLAIDRGLTYVAGSFSGQGHLDDANPSLLNVDLASIALSNGNKSFSFRAKVDNNVTPSSVLAVNLASGSTYSATSGSTTADRDYLLTASSSTTVSALSFIDAVQSVVIVNDNGNQVADGTETLKYTIVLTNNGPSATNVNYSEVIPAGTTFVVGSLTSTHGTVHETNTTDLITAVGNMHNGGVVTITYQVVIDADVAPGSEIVAQGSVDSDETIAELSDSDGNEANGDQPQITPVGGLPVVLDALYVQQLADWTLDADTDGKVSPGDTITMHYFIENRGNGQLTNVSVTDIIANGLSYVVSSAVVDSGTIRVTTNNVAIDIANIASGSQVLASITLTINEPLFNSDHDANAEMFVMQATINSDQTKASKADQNGILADGYQPTTISAVTAGGSPVLDVVQQWRLSNDNDDDGFIDAGDEVTYWITVINNGAVTATNVELKELIPDNTRLIAGSVTSSQGVTITESPVNVYLLDLTPSKLVTISYRVIVDGATADGTVVSAQANVIGDNFAAVLSDDNGQKADGINPTLFTVNNSDSTILGSALSLLSSSNVTTTAHHFIQGETLTLQGNFTLPAGTTKDVVLRVNIPQGLTYQQGSAALSHYFDTGLHATHNPAGINALVSGALVNVDSLLTSTGNSVFLTLGTIVNSDNDVGDEYYQLNLTLTTNTIIPTANSNDVIATAKANFLDSLNQVQASQAAALTLTLLNQLPIAVDDNASTDEDTAVVVTLLSNDSELDNGQSLAISAVTSPVSKGTVLIANDGNSITYTPAQDFFGIDRFNYTLTDSAGGANTATVTIAVNSVEDAPVAVNDVKTVKENSGKNIVDVLNNDTDGDGDPLTVTTATSEFGTVSINGDGTLNYVPAINFYGNDKITYSISDGNGGVASAVVAVNVITNLAPTARDDNYTLKSFEPVVFDILSNDTDPEEGVIELVAANISSGTIEIIDGKVKFTPEPGMAGVVVINYTISDEHGNLTTATATITIESEHAPILTIPDDLCGVFEVDANALYTRVNLGEASAVDRFGNPVPVSLVGGSSLYPPGVNKALWRATDREGNTTIEQQRVCIKPLVSIEKDQTIFEGSSADFTVYLNGESPVYPLVIPFSVSGHEDDHNLSDHEVVITSGTQATVSFETLADGTAEDDETVTVTLSDTLNLGAKYQHNFVITEGNIAPEITLTVEQATEKRLTVVRSGGVVTVTSAVYDPNQTQGFSYEWQSANSDVWNSSTQLDEFTFDPADLALGVYNVSVTVTDSGAPKLSGITSIYINVTDTLATLTGKDSDGDLIPDNLEGYQDEDGDGIPDYLDRIDECNVLQEEAAVYDGYLIEGQSGVCLRRGDISIDAQKGGAQIIDEDNILIEDPLAINIGGIFDYIAYGLPDTGMTFAIVMPQRKPIPHHAVYRKYRAIAGWGFFIEDERNSLWSTAGEPGYCPPPNSSDNNNIWTPGLSQGDWCVQQIIEDGGVNDDDGLVNSMIVDPGGVSVMITDNNLPVAMDDNVEMTINVETTIDVLINDTDGDSDTLTITSAVANIGSVVIVDNQLVYVPVYNYGGDITINYGLTDDNGGTDHAVVYLTVNSNLAPDVSNESTEINQGESSSINLLANDTDPESDELSLITVDNANVSFDASGQATFSPDEDFHGLVTILYSVQDSAGNVALGSWEVMVTEVIKTNAKTTGGALLHIISLLMLIMFIRTKLQRGRK